MYLVIVSDLHLGAGDALEDFLLWEGGAEGPSDRQAAAEALEKTFGRFLRKARTEAARLGLEPHLLLLGDIFDLWQARRHRERRPAALMRILEAHPRFIAELRRWIDAGGKIHYVLGNHDQPLVDPAAWEILREILPGLNPKTRGTPAHYFSDEASGLYAEHGHQWDPFNRLRNLSKPGADCAGRRIVRHIVRPLEPMVPLIDKGGPFSDVLRVLWEEGERHGLLRWEEVLGRLSKLVGHQRGPARAIQEEIHRPRRIDRPAPDFARLSAMELQTFQRAQRQALHARYSRTTGPLPSSLRFLVCGHTHRPIQFETTIRGRRIGLLNGGTWRPLLEDYENDEPIIHQRLNFVVVRPEGEGWTAELREWELDL